MPKQTEIASLEILNRLIESSVFLASKRKAELRSTLPSLTKVQQGELLRILQSEDDILVEIAKQAITCAVERSGTGFLEELEEFLSDALRKLRRTEERVERGSETEHTEHLFDDTP